MTRIDKFKLSFKAFMEIIEIEKWNFVKDRPGHSGCHHDFTLTIPSHYNDDIPHYVEDGTMEWHTVSKTQNRPSHEEFETKFTEYFEPHGDRVWNRVYLGEHEIDDNDVYKLTVRLRLSNGSGLPFPSSTNDEMRFQRLERENGRLRACLDGFRNETNSLTNYWQNRVRREHEQRVKLRRLRERDRSQMNEMNARHVTRIVNKLKTYYTNQKIKDDCPICFEKIDGDKLYVPACCHYLCEPCANHVKLMTNTCPICRDPLYTALDENEMPLPPPLQRHEHQMIPFPDIIPNIDIGANV